MTDNNLYNGLPHDLITQIRRLIEPYVMTEREQRGLITEAFLLIDPRMRFAFHYGDNAILFARDCTNYLMQNRECLPTQTHSVSRLLEVISDQCGVTDQKKIQEITEMLDPRCRGGTPLPPSPTAPTPPITTPPQTFQTPPNDRTPTVFVSYSHRDSALAERLIADLQNAGHAVWIDTTRLKGGHEWVRGISEGILNSYAVIVMVSPAALDSKWVRDEILWAKQRDRLIIPVILDDSVLNHIDFFSLNSYQGVKFTTGYEGALPKLLTALPAPFIPSSEDSASSVLVEKHPRSQRELELEYLDRLRLEVLLNTEKYTALAGQSQVMHERRSVGRVAAVVMRPEYVLLAGERGVEQAVRRFDNAVEEIVALRRAVVLGEPGAGKTTTLWRLASELVQMAIDDPSAPVPLVIRLGRWAEDGQSFEMFIRQELGNLGVHLDSLLREKRAALLFDGLNEIPVSQRKMDRADKDRQIERFIREHDGMLAVVSCRTQDYNTDLGFGRIEITPLDPIRIREFLVRYLGDEKGLTLFRRLVGERATQTEAEFMAWSNGKFTNTQQVFWVATELPDGLQWGDIWNDHWRRWLRERERPSSLLVLSRNPYMLTMLTEVYERTGSLPENRGELFRNFVETLLLREKLVQLDKATQQVVVTPDAASLLRGLSQLAYEMQTRRNRDREGDALTVLPVGRARQYLDQNQLYHAGSASLLLVGDRVRFSHQLLQEYFAARHMDEEIRAGRLKATEIWKPENWWERTNWEEAVILLAGLYSDDCSTIVEWVNAANPEVAAQCVVRSGTTLAHETRERLTSEWLVRLTDTRREPNPLARASVGRALGLTGWDTRKGVGLGADGLPEFDWAYIPAGEFTYGDGDKDKYPIYAKPADHKTLKLPTFKISRYLVTYKQFQSFIDAPDGFHDSRWWDGLKASDEHKSTTGDQVFKFWNHPRERVSWYDAIAFCRWLSYRLGGKWSLDDVDQWLVRLPTEFEWERVARGMYGLVYPYGDEFNTAKGNTSETGIGQTSAVGMFSDGASPDGVLDMSGNVWQWCLTDHSNPALDAVGEDLRTNARRVLRGGHWFNFRADARASARLDNLPFKRFSYFGFRVVFAFPPSHGY